MNMRRPFITHIGLGDSIVQAPLAIAISERDGPVAFPAYKTYMASVESFFVHHPLVTVYQIPDYQKRPDWPWGGAPEKVFAASIAAAGMNGATPIRAGIYKGRLMEDFSKTFYRDTNVPYSVRFEKCPIKEAAKLVKQVEPVFPNERKIFLHDDPSRNFRIKRLIPTGEMTFRPNPHESHLSCLRYADVIRAAKEIHVIDSGFFWLVNALLVGEPITAQLFFHCYPRWPHHKGFRYETRLPWQYLT
jgi:hypothetical protein